MALPLDEVLKDPDILQELKRNPDSFRFKDGASLVVTMQAWPPHTRLLPEDFRSNIGMDGIPTSFPVFGPMANLLNLLAKSLNFTYKQVRPPDGFWGSKSVNGTWSGMMGQVVRKEVDFGLGPFGVVKSRYDDTDVTVPLFFDVLGIMAPMGNPSIDPWAFLMTVTSTVWGVFFVALAITCLTHSLLEYRRSKRNWSKKLGQIALQYLKPPLCQAFTEKVHLSWQRCLMGTWMLVSLIFIWSYKSTLMSMMALRHIPHPIETLRQLIDNPQYKIIFEPDSVILATIRRVEYGEIKELNDLKFDGRYVYHKTQNFPTYSYLIRNGDHVQISGKLTALTFMAQDFSHRAKCDMYWAPDTFLTFMFSMVVQKNSPLTPAINAKIQRVIEAGLYDYWLERSIANITACANAPTKVTLKEPIGFDNIWGLAVIWNIGMCLSFFVLIAEIIVHTCTK